MFEIKIKCSWCRGDKERIIGCPVCNNTGCFKMSIIEYICLMVARYLKVLLDRYGE